MKFPFNQIYPTLEKILDESLRFYLAENLEKYQEGMDKYYAFLQAVGWTEDELDKELLRQIDNNWEPGESYEPQN
jgi:hypothetical protein